MFPNCKFKVQLVLVRDGAGGEAVIAESDDRALWINVATAIHNQEVQKQAAMQQPAAAPSPSPVQLVKGD